MTELARPDLHAAIEQRYPDNTTERITPELLRDGLHEIVDSVVVKASDGGAVPNVPLYKAGTDYAKDYTVRYPTGTGVEAFYYSLRAGKLPAPSGSTTDVNWKVVPGPVSTAALSQQLTLLQAQGIEGSQVVPGRTYLVDFGPDANGYAQVVTLLGTAANLFAIRGQLTVNGVRRNVRVNVASGVFGEEISNLLDTANTWQERQTFLKGLGLYNGAGFDEYGQLSLGQILLADKFLWRGSVQKMASDVVVGWSPDDYAGQANGPDVALGRVSAGVLGVNTGTAGQLATLSVLDVLVSSVQNVALNTFSKLAAFVQGLVPRLGSTTSADPAATTSSVSSLLARLFGLSDRLDLLARYIIRWDQEKSVTLDQDYQGSLSYTSGQAFTFTSGTYAPGIIRLVATDYGRKGDLIAVRIAVGSKDLVFNKGHAAAFYSATGPATIPALAGYQYIFHLVRPDPNSVDNSYWVVHSRPSTGTGSSYDDTALIARLGATTKDDPAAPLSTVKAVLSQALTLADAQSMIAAGSLLPGRTYIVDFGPDATGKSQIVYASALQTNLFNRFTTVITGGAVISQVLANFKNGVLEPVATGGGASTFGQLGGAPRENAALATELDAVNSLTDGRRDLVTIASNRFNDLVLERKVTLTGLKLATNTSSIAAQVLAEGTTAVSSPRTGSPADLLAALQADINGLASWSYYIIRVQTTPVVSTDVTHVLLTLSA